MSTFYTDNMTANEILNLSDEVLSSLNTRDMSRALRTVSLVANKRINRLMKQAKKTKDGYVLKKSATHNVALDSLNAITKDGKKKIKYGVKQAKNRNQMYEQLSEIRKFMGMQTSTIAGATSVRKQRELRLFGKTTENAVKREKTKQGKKNVAQTFADKMKIAFKKYRQFLEYEGLPNDRYFRYEGSDSILSLVGSQILDDNDPETVLQNAIDKYEKDYINSEKQYNEIIKSKGFTF